MAAISKQLEPGIERVAHQHSSGWHVGQSEVSERKNEHLGMGTRTDGRRAIFGRGPSKYWSERVASLNRNMFCYMKANECFSGVEWHGHDFSSSSSFFFFTDQFQMWCDMVMTTLRTSLSGTFLQTLPDLVTPLKGHSLSPRSCPATRSAYSERFGYW